ncbi:MAG: hypothetical protein Q9190_003231 [Brigantiaea leucoxantha]
MAIPSQPPQPLSFPPSHFAKLAPKSYLTAHLTSPSSLRPSSRTSHQPLPVSVNTSSLTHCHGSAVVRLGDTAVVCGIRAEILRVADIPDYTPATTLSEISSLENKDHDDQESQSREEAEEIARIGLFIPNVDLSTGCSPLFLPGAPPPPEAQSLSHRLLTLFHTSRPLPLSSLRIWHSPSPAGPQSAFTQDIEPEEEEEEGPTVKAFFTLHTTLLFLSLSSLSSALPSAWLALLAALRTTRLPKAWWDADIGGVVCSPLREDTVPITVKDPVPIVCSFGLFVEEGVNEGMGRVGGTGRDEIESRRRKWILVDPDGFEEKVCEGEVTVAVREGEKGMEFVRIEKGGGGGIGKEEMKEVLTLAGDRWREWMEVLRRST